MIPQLENKLAFKKLYTEYFSILVNFGFSKTRDWELSREIVQNTFVKLWTRREQTNITSSIKSYLFMMVKNAIIDHYRRTERFTDIDQLPETGSEDTNLQQEEDTIILRHVIKQALSNMKPKHKMIFELSKFEGLTYAEIAEHLGVSEITVEDNIAKAIIQIREEVKLYNNS